MTTRNVQLPGTFRSTFWLKKTIEKLLPLPCVCQNTPSLPWLALIFSKAAMELLTPRNWWFLAMILISPPLVSSKTVKFSTRSRNRVFSHVPRIRVSREMTPFSPSLLIRFQSEKCSQPAVMLPILAWLPLDRMMTALYQNSCGIVLL